jgi:hypothetical protein
MKKPLVLAAVLLLALSASLGISCGSKGDKTEEDGGEGNGEQTTTITPADSPAMPARGYFKGSLPNAPAGVDMSLAYSEVAKTMEFVPVWGRPTPFYDLAADLSGDYGSMWVEQLIRGNGMFPFIHMSFLDTGVTLKVPAGMSGATLSDANWRQAYKQAALDVVRAARPLYFSVGNEVNRWYEK